MAEYIAKHGLAAALDRAVNKVLHMSPLPDDPIHELANQLRVTDKPDQSAAPAPEAIGDEEGDKITPGMVRRRRSENYRVANTSTTPGKMRRSSMESMTSLEDKDNELNIKGGQKLSVTVHTVTFGDAFKAEKCRPPYAFKLDLPMIGRKEATPPFDEAPTVGDVRSISLSIDVDVTEEVLAMLGTSDHCAGPEHTTHHHSLPRAPTVCFAALRAGDAYFAEKQQESVGGGTELDVYLSFGSASARMDMCDGYVNMFSLLRDGADLKKGTVELFDTTDMKAADRTCSHGPATRATQALRARTQVGEAVLSVRCVDVLRMSQRLMDDASPELGLIGLVHESPNAPQE